MIITVGNTVGIRGRSPHYSIFQRVVRHFLGCDRQHLAERVILGSRLGKNGVQRE